MAERSIFDNINDVFFNKTNWEEYSETDRKKFSPFMMNRWISMSPDYIGVINYLQQYTVGILQNREVYKLFKDLFPKVKFFTKYTKVDKESEDKISPNLIKFLCERFCWNESETVSNLQFIKQEDLISYLKDHGYSDSDIKKQFKLK